MGGGEGDEELGLGDVVDVSPDKGLELLAVRPFQDAKTTDIERLGDMRGMGRETEGNNILLLAVFLELGRKMAFMTV